MLETGGKYLTVYLSSMVKFVAGPIAGLATGLSFWETALFSVFGMMSTVLILTFIGPKLRSWVNRRFMRKRKRFSPRSRRFVRIWRRWGVFGVSFLTPLILTPIGGALLANAFCYDRQKILLYMLASAVFWGLAISGIFYGGLNVIS